MTFLRPVVERTKVDAVHVTATRLVRKERQHICLVYHHVVPLARKRGHEVALAVYVSTRVALNIHTSTI